MLARDLSIQGQELSIEPSRGFSPAIITEDDSTTLLPIPASGGIPAGILVLGGRSILFFDVVASEPADKGKGKEKNTKGKGSRKSHPGASSSGIFAEPRTQIDWPLCDITSRVDVFGLSCAKCTNHQLYRYDMIEPDGSRVLLGDGFGKLSILSLTRSTSETSLTLVQLGEVCPSLIIVPKISFLKSAV